MRNSGSEDERSGEEEPPKRRQYPPPAFGGAEGASQGSAGICWSAYGGESLGDGISTHACTGSL